MEQRDIRAAVYDQESGERIDVLPVHKRGGSERLQPEDQSVDEVDAEEIRILCAYG